MYLYVSVCIFITDIDIPPTQHNFESDFNYHFCKKDWPM